MNEKEIIRYDTEEIKEIIRNRIFVGGLFSMDLKQKELKEKRSILCKRVESLIPIIDKLNEHAQLFNEVNLLSSDFTRTNPRNEHLKFIPHKQYVCVGIKKEGDEVYDIPEEALLILEECLTSNVGLTFQELKDQNRKDITVTYEPDVFNSEEGYAGYAQISLYGNTFNAEVPNMFLDWIIFGLEPFAINFYSWIDNMKKSYL